jgi:RNA polymerase primary sigma factor
MNTNTTRRAMNISNPTNSFVVRTDSVKRYLSDINKVKVMTAQEEKDLFAKYFDSKARVESVKNSSLPESTKMSIINNEERIQTEIRNEIILRNQRFNFAIAKRYDNNAIIMDLVSVGTIGMYEAFEKYDPSEGVRFCSLANWYIRRAINAYLVKENLTVRTTNNTRVMPKVKKIENEFFLLNGRKPSGPEVMDILLEKYGIEVAAESDIYGARVESIDATFNEEDDNTFEKCADFVNATASVNGFEESMEGESLSEAMSNALKALNERERTIISMSCGYGYNKEYKDKEIAEALGLTSERVRQIRHVAKTKLAKAYIAIVK